MSSFQPVRGTRDLLPAAFQVHKRVIDTAQGIAARYGFHEMSPPILEFTKVFARTMGETSDVVTKEMYNFMDRGGDEQISLRPEFTAGICRAFISNGMYDQVPFKAFAAGPLFRYERPQKGRQRQFHQIDLEILGVPEPMADIEALAVGHHILEELGVLEDITLKINTLGSSQSRGMYRAKLIDYLEPFERDLSDDSRDRLHRNPLRIFDSKSKQDQDILAEAPLLQDSLDTASRQFFDKVCDGLVCLDIPFSLDAGLVRGLDYYTHTAFEFVTENLGAHGAVIAGGRYDGLIEQLGGRPTPGIGWAGGIERLALMVGEAPTAPRPIAIIPLGAAAEMRAQILARDLRKKGFVVEYSYTGNMKRRLSRANKIAACAALIMGDDELSKSIVTVRDMDSGAQWEIPIGSLSDSLSHYR